MTQRMEVLNRGLWLIQPLFFVRPKQRHISTLWYIANMIHYTDDLHNSLSELD